MKTNKIIEGNRLIAEFMGVEFKDAGYSNKIAIIKGGYYFPNELLYHSSWDWLMPVVEKIEYINQGIYQVDILQEGCSIKRHCKDINLNFTVGKLPPNTTKIQSVWLACIEFIKWYNQKEKQL